MDWEGVGTGPNLKRGILDGLAPSRTAQNHYAFKAASFLDRTLKAARATARNSATQLLNTLGETGGRQNETFGEQG